MKKIIIAISLIVAVLCRHTSAAQENSFNKLPSKLASANSLKSFASTKMLRSFLGYFKNASEPVWYPVRNHFMAKFEEDGLENRALFTKDGLLIYHLRYGTENLLPSNVRRLIKSTYYDQVITRVLRVFQDRRIIWVVYMEDDREYIMARVEDLDLEETKRMTKSK